MDRKKVIAGNWKMNIMPSQTMELINSFKGKFDSKKDVVLCVPYTNLHIALEAARGTEISIGAQNMHENENGAFTGEVSAQMLTDIGIKYVIIGHSERREYYGETDEAVNKKIVAALNASIIPILCVGEKLDERNKNITLEIINKQIKIALNGLSKEKIKNIIIAYEPIWAIGTGLTATNEQAEEVCKAIRDLIKKLYDNDTANTTTILYGGSVNAKNAKELFSMPNIDGGLVGGASLKAEFLDVVNV